MFGLLFFNLIIFLDNFWLFLFLTKQRSSSDRSIYCGHWIPVLIFLIISFLHIWPVRVIWFQALYVFEYLFSLKFVLIEGRIVGLKVNDCKRFIFFKLILFHLLNKLCCSWWFGINWWIFHVFAQHWLISAFRFVCIFEDMGRTEHERWLSCLWCLVACSFWILL